MPMSHGHAFKMVCKPANKRPLEDALVRLFEKPSLKKWKYHLDGSDILYFQLPGDTRVLAFMFPPMPLLEAERVKYYKLVFGVGAVYEEGHYDVRRF